MAESNKSLPAETRLQAAGVALVCLTLTMPGASQAEDCTSPVTTLQMQICADADFAKADKQLNIDYKAARTYMESLDKDLSPDLKGAAEALLKAQRAWIAFRDAACFADGFVARGGTEEPLLVASCKTSLTQQRSKQLRELAASP